jgi:fructosamine-3-kinase
MKIPRSLAELISRRFKSEIVSANSCFGGCINNAVLVELKNSQKFFIKWNSQVSVGFFEAEALGLNELRASGALKIPEVIDVGEPSNDIPSYLILEALNEIGKSPQLEKDLAIGLAKLHRTTNQNFGFKSDNFIGSLEQINKCSADWGKFFFEQRLLVQSNLAIDRKMLTDEFLTSLLKIKFKIIDVLNEYPSVPSLVHGDLWSGNIFWSTEGPALIDPAVYYGHREVDLAFSEMFGGFSAAFYQTYNSEWPLDKDYPKRKKILNLYHLLTHSNLFGGSYVESAKQMLRSI